MSNPSTSAGDRKKGAGLAKLGLWLAVLCVLLLIAVVIATRTGAIGIRDAFGTIKWIVYGGSAVALISLLGCLQAIMRKNMVAGIMAVVGLVIALLIVWIPYSNRVALRASPRLSDITTDMQNPPAFDKIAALRKAAKARNPMTYGPKKAKIQMARYPDIKPARLALPIDKAFERTVAAVNNLQWTVVAVEEPAGRRTGRIEAFETSLIFGFVDDVVVRVTADGTGSRIDIRSSSRVGRRDAAVNANRIRKLIRALKSP
jgi:uncharacterized protein (DUF1499 family)